MNETLKIILMLSGAWLLVIIVEALDLDMRE